MSGKIDIICPYCRKEGRGLDDRSWCMECGVMRVFYGLPTWRTGIDRLGASVVDKDFRRIYTLGDVRKNRRGRRESWRLVPDGCLVVVDGV